MKAYLGILGIHGTLKFANFIKNIARHTWDFKICIFYIKPKLGILGILGALKFAYLT